MCFTGLREDARGRGQEMKRRHDDKICATAVLKSSAYDHDASTRKNNGRVVLDPERTERSVGFTQCRCLLFFFLVLLNSNSFAATLAPINGTLPRNG